MARPFAVPLALALLALAPRPAACDAPEAAAPALVPFVAEGLAEPAAPPVRPELASALALPAAGSEAVAPLRLFGRHRAPKPARPSPDYLPLGADRARILLRSLTVPGWGQATLGHRHAAAYFAVAEAGIWGSFTAFRIQELMRTLDYQRTARLFAGIDLKGRDDEYMRIVGAYPNSDLYNQYVVARDAANLYLADPQHPDIAGYQAYIAAHSITGSNAWHWTDEASFLRYGAQRKNAQRASLRANAALGFAVANRIVSALHAMRLSNHAAPAPAGTSWRFELAPAPDDPLTVRAGLRADF